MNLHQALPVFVAVWKHCAHRGWIPQVFELPDEMFVRAKAFCLEPHHDGTTKIVNENEVFFYGTTVRRGTEIRAGLSWHPMDTFVVKDDGSVSLKPKKGTRC